MSTQTPFRKHVMLCLVLLAGTAVPLMAQDTTRPAEPPKQKAGANDRDRKNAQPGKDRSPRATSAESQTPDLRSCHWLGDRPVVNDNMEDVAKTSDFILDRGSGRIQFAVLRTGTVLGMGGKSVAIPFASLRWDPANERFVLASTPEQLKTWPEFSAETWSAVMEPGKAEPGDLAKRLTEHGPAAYDPYVGGLDPARTSRVEGTVEKVERVDGGRFGEQVEITVKTPEGPRRVALGPSWFVNGAGPAPMRGDKVVIDTIAIADGKETALAATKVTCGSREAATLRESDGSPAWGLKSLKSDGKEYSSTRWRYVLLSDLRGAKIECRGEECGKVADIILDRRSGQAAFISIDPNQNFLGIGDTKHIAPWSVATVGLNGTVRLDASKEMILASPQTPSDVATLNAGEGADMIYRAYQTSAPDFRSGRSAQSSEISPNDPWGAKGTICASIDHGSKRSITGAVESIETERFASGIPAATVVNVRAAGELYAVVLGPAWFMQNQKLDCRSGDTVSIEACRATIDNREHWIATTLECKGNRVVLLDGGRSPAWDRK